MKSKPTVSIVMSVYNAEKWLMGVFGSVLAQTFKNFEIIVVDDGSKDNSKNLIFEQCANDERVRLIENEKNMGLTYSLNRGLQKAKGKYIARIDVDDVWEPTKLGKQIEYLELHPEVGLVGTAYLDINKEGKVIGRPSVKFVETDQQIRETIFKYNPFFHSSVLFRKEIYNNLGGYNNKYYYAQDYEYWVRIISRYEVYNMPEVLAYRRIDENNISIKKERKQRMFAVKAKLKAISLERGKKLNYRFLLNDIAVIVLPKSLLKALRETLKYVNAKNIEC